MTSSACTQPVACKAPLRPSNTKAPRRGSRFTQQHGRAMLLSGMLLCVAVMILRPCAGRLATAAAHSTQHIRGEEDARVVAAVSASQAAGAGAGGRGLQSLGDDEAPGTDNTPESDYYGEVVHGLPYVDEEDVVEDCPVEFRDVVLGPGRRLLMFCYQCPCRCPFCCGVESSVFHGTCRRGNGSNVMCGQRL